MDLRVVVRKPDSQLADNICGRAASTSESVRVNEINGTVTMQRIPASGAFPGEGVLTLVIQFAGQVSAGIVANWLYYKLRDRCSSAEVNGRPCAVDKNALTRCIEEGSVQTAGNRGIEDSQELGREARTSRSGRESDAADVEKKA